MTEFRIDSMNCGHCASSVKEALRRADPEAQVEVDLASKTVRVESSRPRDDLAGALSDAGYAPA